ncbi:MAG: TIGR00730 family Rossman fold protein [Bdellovibrionaceae bacterium]|nr:TIGR00730 family Rossman fold protein [Bdellovibrionales bacterium]MCB9253057.1 TIGR00730 family Rossman fold protein [Pseudobdellovibrionaceae bacterium]
MKHVCVFCGAAPGNNSEFVLAASRLGELIAEKGMKLIYGGGRVGLMGVLADGALRAGGEVIGVIPSYLRTEEIAHTGITELIVVDTLAERKQKMYELSDSFISLPGGLGTLDEMFEILTWYQLGFHTYPMGLLNTADFFDKLLEFLDLAGENQFLRINHRAAIAQSSDPEDLLTKMEAAPVERVAWQSERPTA